MHVQAETKPYDSINVTPMLDLAYVLLVIFILMTTASVSGMSINLPKPSNKPSTEKHEIKIIQIKSDGQPSVGALAEGVKLCEVLRINDFATDRTIYFRLNAALLTPAQFIFIEGNAVLA